MIIAHKIRLDPTDKQATYFARAAGTARFSYNWALEEWQRQYLAHKADPSLPKPSQYSLRRQLNAIKRQQFPWMMEVTKCAPQMAIIQLGAAFKNFFAQRTKYPTKRKKGIHDRFSLTNDQVTLDGFRIRIPILGWVRIRERLRFTGKIMSATVSRQANRWFVSVAVETNDLQHLPKAENQGVVGVDLGVSALATLSTGETPIEGPRALKKLLGRLRRLSRRLASKQKGSANRAKAKSQLALLHARIGAIRRDSLHKLSSDLTRRFHTIGIEDLNVRGMLRNGRLARSIADMGFHELRRQLEYKAWMRGGQIVVADRFFPSSKICSMCGFKLDVLALSVRNWVCHSCGNEHERDFNAAVNLEKYAVSSTVSACGEEGSGRGCKITVKPALMKQEVNTKATYT